MPEFKIRITGDCVELVNTSTQASQSLGKVAEATKNAGHEAEKTTGHLHGMHKVFHALNEIVPGLGVLMQSAFSPIGAVLSFAVIGLRAFHEKMKEVNEEFRKAEEELAKPLTSRLEAMRETTMVAAAAFAELKNKIEEAAASKTRLNPEKMVSDLGLVGAVPGETASQKQARENENRRQALQLAKDQQEGLEAKAKAALEAKIKAEENLRSLPSNREVTERATSAEARLKAFQAQHPEWTEWFEEIGLKQKPEDVAQRLGTSKNLSAFQASGGFKGIFGGAGLADMYEEWSRLKTGAIGSKREFDQFPGAYASRKAAVEAAARAAEQAQQEATKNAEFIGAAPGEIWRGEQKLRVDQGNEVLKDRKELESKLVQGQHEEMRLRDQIAKSMASRSGINQAILAHLQEVIDEDRKLKAQIEQLTKSLRNP